MNPLQTVTSTIRACRRPGGPLFQPQSLIRLVALLCGAALLVGSAAAQEATPKTQQQEQEQQAGKNDQAQPARVKIEGPGGQIDLKPVPPPKVLKRPVTKKIPTQTPEGPVTGAPGIRCEETVHDFGQHWSGGKLKHDFIISNAGDQVLKLVSVKASCGCTVAKGYDKEVPPGGTGRIPVELHTKKVRGRFSKHVTVNSNDSTTPALRLTIKGLVKNHVDVTPRAIAMGHVAEEANAVKSAKLTNNSEDPLSLTLLSDKTGPFTAEVVETVPGKEFELKITATPPYKAKLNRGKFVLKTNLKAQSVVEVPVTLYMPPRLDVRPEHVVLPPKTGKEQQRVIKFANNGEKPVAVLAAEVDDDLLRVEVITHTTGKVYEVRLTVPPNYDPPTKPRTITLTTDDPQQSEFKIPVKGRRQRQRPATRLAGKPAPAAEFTTVGGQTIKTGVETGQVTVLDFFASWCGYCKKQIPMLAKLHEQKYADNPNVRFVGVNQDTLKKNGATSKRARTPEQIGSMWAKTQASFDYALDPGQKGKSKFLVQSYPTLVLLGKDGKVEAVHFGATPDLAATLEAQIDALLEGKSLASIAQGPINAEQRSRAARARVQSARPTPTVEINPPERREKASRPKASRVSPPAATPKGRATSGSPAEPADTPAPAGDQGDQPGHAAADDS